MSESRGMWFLLGLSVGALAGILYAPQTGEQTRELLGRKAGEGKDLVQRRASELRNQVSGLGDQADVLRTQASDFAERGKQAVTRQIDQFQAAIEAGKQAYRETVGTDRAPEKSGGSSGL